MLNIGSYHKHSGPLVVVQRKLRLSGNCVDPLRQWGSPYVFNRNSPVNPDGRGNMKADPDGCIRDIEGIITGGVFDGIPLFPAADPITGIDPMPLQNTVPDGTGIPYIPLPEHLDTNPAGSNDNWYLISLSNPHSGPSSGYATGSAHNADNPSYRPSGGGRRDSRILNLVLTIASAHSGYNEFSRVSFGHWYSPSAGRWYEMGHYGRTSLTLQSEVVLSAKAFRVASRLLVTLGVGISFYNLVFNSNTKGEYFKNGFEMGLGVAAFFGGPVTVTLVSFYYIVDTTIGWDNLFESYDRIRKRNIELLGPNYQYRW